MRASSRRSHHSSAVGAGREAPAQREAFGLERARARPRSRCGSSPSGAASARCGHRPQALEPAAHDLDQRLLARPSRARHRRPARRSRARASRRATAPGTAAGARPRPTASPPACAAAPRACSPRKLGQPVAPARPRLRPRPRSGSRARPAHRAARRRSSASGQASRAHARDRLGIERGRGRPRPRARASAALITACVRRSSSGASSRKA